MTVEFLFAIAVLIFSVVVHEVSHGVTAGFFGDPTARLSGRITLNPVSHLDPFGSFILPTLSYFLGGFIIGWAKPVPYNPDNLRNRPFSETLVAASGAISNLLIAFIFGMVIRISSAMEYHNEALLAISGTIVVLNLILAVFNLIPIPPLDGSKVLFSLLPYRFRVIQNTLETYWPVALIVVLLVFPSIISPAVSFLYYLFAGVSPF